ncbi:MAG TPA: permease [Gammaproteobacteria bacterium]|nr:permease [Gammaproteobacteria bacterium]
MNATLHQFATTVWQIVSESAFWVIASLLVGGLVREFLPSSRFRTLLNRKGQVAMLGAIAFGAILPICSCGVIPLAISLYRSGVRLGPVMAFAAATPIINPAAVILSLALLGPQITLAYVTLGLVLPYLLGLIAERWGEPLEVKSVAEASACCSGTQSSGPAVSPASGSRLLPRIAAGLRWGFTDLGPTIAFYMTIGVLLAGLIAAFLPTTWVDSYLRDSSGIALLAAGVLGASIYVCAVGHIPLVASLLATGAAPGISIVFLVTGTATNLPELIALYNTIGKRTVVLYVSALITGAMLAGVAVNAWLLPGFEPVFDPLRSLELVDLGEGLHPTIGNVVSLVSTAVLIALAGLGIWRWVAARFSRRSASDGSGDSCCSG